MFRRVYGKVPWRTVSVLFSILAIAALTTEVSARGGGGGRAGGGGGVPRMGGASSVAGRGFSGGSPGGRGFSAPSRSSGDAGRSFAAPSRSSSPDRSFSAPSRNYSMGAPSGRGMSSTRPPADFRASQPRIGNEFRASQPRVGRDAAGQPRFSDDSSLRSMPDASRSADAFAGRNSGRSGDSFDGRTYSRSSRDLGISRPDSPSRRIDAGSLGSVDRSSRGMGDISRSGIADRSTRSIARGTDSISRQIARPDSLGRGSNLQRGMSDSIGRADRSSPISRSMDSISRGDRVSRQSSSTADRSQPVWRNNDSVSRQISRTGDRASRGPELTGRTGRSESLGRTAERGSVDRAPISRPLDRSSALADAGSIRRSADLGRSLGISRGMRGGDAIGRVSRSDAGFGRSGTNVSRSAGSLARSGVTRGNFGRDGFSQFNRTGLQAKGVHVASAKYYGGHWGGGGYHGGSWHGGHWDGHGYGHGYWGHGSYWGHGGYWGHHGYWGHGGWHHGYWGYPHRGYWRGAAFCGWYGGGYWSNWGWNCWNPSWSFGFSFGWYPAPAVVGCGFATVYPSYVYYPWYPPVVTYYSTYAWPALYQPVVFSPIVTPVYTPVVVAPAYYYWNPAYYYYTYPTVYSAPAVGVSVGVSADAAAAQPADAVQPTATDPGQDATAAAPAGDNLEQGLTALRNGQVETAREHLSRAVSADPSSGVAQMLYTAALVADGQYKSASLSLQEGLQAWGNVQLKDFYLPNVYGDAQSYAQYTRDLRAFLSDNPDRLDGWLLTIWATAFSGKSAEATQFLAEAKKTWSDDPALQAMEKIVGSDASLASR